MSKSVGGVCRPSPEELELYPLAQLTGWKATRCTTGGMLFLYPPRVSVGDDPCLLLTTGVESVHPDDYSHGVGEMLHEFYKDTHRYDRRGDGRQRRVTHVTHVRQARGTLIWTGDNS